MNSTRATTSTRSRPQPVCQPITISILVAASPGMAVAASPRTAVAAGCWRGECQPITILMATSPTHALVGEAWPSDFRSWEFCQYTNT